jgi:hypothetical protein
VLRQLPPLRPPSRLPPLRTWAKRSAADPNAQTILTPEPEALSLDLSAPAAAAPETKEAQQSGIITPPPSPEPAGLEFADFGEPDETPSGDATHVFDAGAPPDSDLNQATQLITPESQPPPPAVPSLDPLPTPSLDASATPAPPEDVASMETMLAPNPGADAPAPIPPPAEPEVDAVLYEETSFLDPRAPLSSNTPAAHMVDPEPPIESHPTPAVEPAFDDDNPESQIFGAPLAPADADSGARIANEDTAPEIGRDTQTLLAAEEALDAVSALPADPAPAAPAPGDTGLSWAEPLEVADDSLTAPDPVEMDPLDEPEFSPLPTPEPPQRLAAADPVDIDPVAEAEPMAEPAMGEALPPQPMLEDPDSEATPLPTTELPMDPAELHATIERVAWEAFGTISEQIVSQVVKKVEEVAWEVIPQLAEKIIQDEIAKLKS